MQRPTEPDERFADWVDGLMSPAERQRFEREVAQDPELRAALGRYLDTVEAVREHGSRERAPRELADSVMAAIGEEEAAAGTGAVIRRLHWGVWGTLAAAAALVVAVVTLGPLRPEDRPAVERTARLEAPAEDQVLGEPVLGNEAEADPAGAGEVPGAAREETTDETAEAEAAAPEDSRTLRYRTGLPETEESEPQGLERQRRAGQRRPQAPEPSDAPAAAGRPGAPEPGREQPKQEPAAPARALQEFFVGRAEREAGEGAPPPLRAEELSAALESLDTGQELGRSYARVRALVDRVDAEVGALLVVVRWPEAEGEKAAEGAGLAAETRRGRAGGAGAEAPAVPWELAPDAAPAVQVRELATAGAAVGPDRADRDGEEARPAFALRPGDRVFAVSAEPAALEQWFGALGRAAAGGGGDVGLVRTEPGSGLDLTLRAMMPAQPPAEALGGEAPAGEQEQGGRTEPREKTRPETVLLVLRGTR